MANFVWLENLGIVHMSNSMTPEKAEEFGSTVISEKHIKELSDILLWLSEHKIGYMPFWNWKHIQKDATENFPACDYWLLCPKIMFIDEEDVVAFKLMWGYS